LARKRAARLPLVPIGEEHTTWMSPAAKHAARWWVFCSRSGELRQVSAKSSLPV
jgi:hypothetical protein